MLRSDTAYVPFFLELCSVGSGDMPLRVDVKHLIFIRSAPYVLGVKHLISMVVRFLG